jgi:hypothetical protein
VEADDFSVGDFVAVAVAPMPAADADSSPPTSERSTLESGVIVPNVSQQPAAAGDRADARQKRLRSSTLRASA